MILTVRHRRRPLTLDLEERRDYVDATSGDWGRELVAVCRLEGRIVAGQVDGDRFLVRTPCLRATFLADGQGGVRSCGPYVWRPDELRKSS